MALAGMTAGGPHTHPEYTISGNKSHEYEFLPMPLSLK